MNRILQNREVQRQQTTAEFVRELNAAVDRDLQGTCDPISELDEKGHPKGAEGTICTFREGKWWRVKEAVCLEICDRIGPMPPDLKVVE
jgi:hypothetical protein